jgi:predicted DCC family thiol-disulfide oxidoreductase YuxK
MHEPIHNEPTWILWDGQCAFCQRWIEWVRSHDRNGRFRAVPFQEVPSPPMTPELYQRCRRAVQVLTPDGTIRGGGEAVAFILRHVGYARLGRLLSWRPIAPLTECGYRVVARNRGLLGRILIRR